MATTTFEKPMGSEVETLKEQITNKNNIKIDAKKTSTSIVALYQSMNVGEEKTFSSIASSYLSDYPSVLSTAGAGYYPHINIKKYSSLYGFVFVQSVVVDGTPKAVLGYYNNGSMTWGQLIN